MRIASFFLSLAIIGMVSGCMRKGKDVDDGGDSSPMTTTGTGHPQLLRVQPVPKPTKPLATDRLTTPQAREVIVIDEDLKQFQGIWRGVLLGDVGRVKLAEDLGLAAIDGGNVRIEWGEFKETMNTRLTIKPQGDPKGIDVTFIDQTYPSIYEMHGEVVIQAISTSDPPSKRVPDADSDELGVAVLVWQKVSAQPNDWVRVRKSIEGWNRERRAAEDLKVAKTLFTFGRSDYARVILTQMMDDYGDTPAGRQASQWLKDPPTDAELSAELLKPLRGVWRCVLVSNAGTDPDPVPDQLQTAVVNGRDVRLGVFGPVTIALDPRNPGHLDVTFPYLSPVPGIWERHGDVAVISLADKRPRQLQLPGKNESVGHLSVWYKITDDPDDTKTETNAAELARTDPEKAATEDVRVARTLMDAGRPVMAKRVLEVVMVRYPGSRSAKNAAGLLKFVK
jgi:hypothetical protein